MAESGPFTSLEGKETIFNVKTGRLSVDDRVILHTSELRGFPGFSGFDHLSFKLVSPWNRTIIDVDSTES